MPNASSWKNGNQKSSGAGYGLRIDKKYRDSYFQKTWSDVILYLPNYSNNPVVIELSPSFWGKCSELRSKEIGIWLINNLRGNWRKRQPYRYTLAQRRHNEFDVV